MDKTGEVSLRGNQWQRLFRWHRMQNVNEEGDGNKEDNNSQQQKLKFA